MDNKNTPPPNTTEIKKHQVKTEKFQKGTSQSGSKRRINSQSENIHSEIETKEKFDTKAYEKIMDKRDQSQQERKAEKLAQQDQTKENKVKEKPTKTPSAKSRFIQMAKTGSKIVGKTLGKVIPPVAVALTAYSIYDKVKESAPKLKETPSVQQESKSKNEGKFKHFKEASTQINSQTKNVKTPNKTLKRGR